MLIQAPLPTNSDAPAAQPGSLNEYWQSIMNIPGASWIIWTSLLVILILVAVYVVGLVRNLAIGGSDVDETDHLSEFRKLRDQGMIDEEEYKRLTAVVPIPIPDTQLESKLANRDAKPSSVHPAPLAGAANSTGEPARRPLTLAEAEALKKKRQESGGSTDPDEADDPANP